MDPKPAKHVVAAKDVDERLCDEILSCCDFSTRGRGRPKMHALGTEPVQMNVEVAARIIQSVVQKIGSEGGVLEVACEGLYTPFGCRQHAQHLLNKMSKRKYGVVNDIAVERLWKTLGDLIPVGMRKVGEGRPLMHYVAKRGAGALELQGAWNTARKRQAENEVRASELNDIFARGLPGMPSNISFGEHYAQSLEAYHRRQHIDVRA